MTTTPDTVADATKQMVEAMAQRGLVFDVVALQGINDSAPDTVADITQRLTAATATLNGAVRHLASAMGHASAAFAALQEAMDGVDGPWWVVMYQTRTPGSLGKYDATEFRVQAVDAEHASHLAMKAAQAVGLEPGMPLSVAPVLQGPEPAVLTKETP